MRNSDRWITPGVIVAGILTAGLVVLGITAAMTWLATTGKDPDPVLRLVAEFTTALSAAGALLLQLWNRTTTTKVERNTGVQANELNAVKQELADVVDYLRPGQHAYAETMLPARGLPPVPERGTAPAAPGSLGA